MKQYIVQQSIDVAIAYVIEAENLEDAENMASGGSCYDRTKIIDISVLDWDRPWEVMEVEEKATPLSEEYLTKWEVIGI